MLKSLGASTVAYVVSKTFLLPRKKKIYFVVEHEDNFLDPEDLEIFKHSVRHRRRRFIFFPGITEVGDEVGILTLNPEPEKTLRLRIIEYGRDKVLTTSISDLRTLEILQAPDGSSDGDIIFYDEPLRERYALVLKRKYKTKRGRGGYAYKRRRRLRHRF